MGGFKHTENLSYGKDAFLRIPNAEVISRDTPTHYIKLNDRQRETEEGDRVVGYRETKHD
jgi:hypothetical protein